MIEEYAFILSQLCVNDHDRLLVLGHELLLLVHSGCCRKRGGGWGSCCRGPTPLDQLPACTLKTLEHMVPATDTIQLECLVWAVFDNVMGLGKMPQLSRFETYSQILRCLVDKAYKRLHMCCPAHTSASFGMEITTIRLIPGGPEPQKSAGLQGHIPHLKTSRTPRGRSSIWRSGTNSRPEHSSYEMDERMPVVLH